MSGSGSPTRYEIRVEGVLDSRWAAWFEGLQVNGQGSQTVISGLVADQPALHGLLVKVRDLGLCLIAVRRLDPDEGGATTNRRRATARTVRTGAGSPPLPTSIHDARQDAKTSR